jgi:hypothetical protein
MNKSLNLLGAMALASFAACTAPTYQQPEAPIQEVPFTQVQINDQFWTPRIETNRTVSIPSAFYQCEINGRFDNFAIAGGLMKGEHKGDFSFDDTDPYKIIEGASYSLAVKYDEKLDHYLDSVINIIAAAQEPDGYLTTCVTNKCYRLSGWWGRSRWEKMNSHELYNSGHLYEAAVAHYRATGKRSLLDVAIKNADLVCKTFGLGEGQIKYPSGHPIIEMALAKLYKVTGDQKLLDKQYECFVWTDSLLFDTEDFLYYRDAKYIYPKVKTACNGGKSFWARGDGWVLAGLAKVLQDLPKDSKYRPFYVKRFQQLAEGVARCQQEEGYWSRSMLCEDDAPGYETSGTAFFTYGMLWGVNNGLLNAKKYKPVIDKAWDYLATKALQPDGSIGYVQPIGEKPDPTRKVDARSQAPFGTGAWLLAACEYINYLQK